MARSRSRTKPVSMIRHLSLSGRLPIRKAAMWSIGFWVAEIPIRTGGLTHRASSRSRDKVRCAPRLLPASACNSSIMTVRTVCNIRRPDSEVRKIKSDSGVVTRMCGGCRRTLARSACGVSPVRTADRIDSGLGEGNSCVIPTSGASRFRLISLDKALSGETYKIRVSSGKPNSSPSRTSSLMTARKAARVLPDPVGAAIKVCEPP